MIFWQKRTNAMIYLGFNFALMNMYKTQKLPFLSYTIVTKKYRNTSADVCGFFWGLQILIKITNKFITWVERLVRKSLVKFQIM